ncbi:uncharacterized protein LOC120079088 [Benincasa hispida]|uniref:uncharacterized protein LOC120079088 n=1 Tax=Benincasa hispida TaxID=102211 RepID=UPI0019029AEF|nr:uncharacterized protein LOC120079088 [Benincasa hispida]
MHDYIVVSRNPKEIVEPSIEAHVDARVSEGLRSKKDVDSVGISGDGNNDVDTSFESSNHVSKQSSSKEASDWGSRSASLWKYVVKRNIVDEKELSYRTQECAKLMELIQTKVHIRRHAFDFSAAVINQFLCRNVPENVREQHPSLRDLVFELTGGARSTWPHKGQLSTTALSVKYVLLHRIGSYNWCPSLHKSSLSIALASLMYKIRTRSQFNYSVFVINQIKCQIGFIALKFSSCFPYLICGILLSQKLDLLTISDVVVPSPSLFFINH